MRKPKSIDAQEVTREWLEERFGSFEDYHKIPARRKIKIFFLQIEDFFGWDYLVLLKDGRVVYTDRNCGLNEVSKNRFTVEEVLNKVK